MSKAVDNIEIGPKWGEMTKLLMFLLSFGANPFDTFRIHHDRYRKDIRMNLISFIKNRNINVWNDVVNQGLNLYYKKYIDNIVNFMNAKYNLGQSDDIVQICEIIVRHYVFGTIEDRYQLGKRRFVQQLHVQKSKWESPKQRMKFEIDWNTNKRPNQDPHDTYYPLVVFETHYNRATYHQ